jgi:hypothetical protein
MDLRCGNGIKFGEVLPEEGVIEVKCRSRRCGHEAGSVVIHRFDLRTGELQRTLKFKDPAYRKEEDNAAGTISPLRTA